MTRILGKIAFERKLARMPERVKAAARKAMESAADDVVRLAQSLVPVEEGTLRDSIGWTWGRPPNGAMTLGKVLTSLIGAEMTLTIYAGSNEAFQARWVEFGTAPHSLAAGADVVRNTRQSSLRQHKGAAAKPYFYPAYRANKRPALRKIAGAVRKEVRATAKEKAAD